MMFLKIPFRIHAGKIERGNDLKSSIDSFLELLVASHYGEFRADSDFGFIFKNFKFENFDEIKGTIKTQVDSDNDDNYRKKISGSSKNPNTFAYDLKKRIEEYEGRLKNIDITMDYRQKEKIITLHIAAKIDNERSDDYKHEIQFHVW